LAELDGLCYKFGASFMREAHVFCTVMPEMAGVWAQRFRTIERLGLGI